MQPSSEDEDPFYPEWLPVVEFIESNYGGDGCSVDTIARELKRKAEVYFMWLNSNNFLVPVHKVRAICKWLIKEDFVMTTFSDDLFFPTEIEIQDVKYDELHEFIKKSTRDVGATFDEICGFMQAKFQGIINII